MNETIRKRKSVRKYHMTALDTAALSTVKAQIAQLTPLFPDIRFTVSMAAKTKGLFGIKAPCYLIFRSEQRDGAYENIGFIGQQMDLFFSESGLGSCWLGMAKPLETEEGALPFVISMAFGTPSEPPHRAFSDFKRKPLSQIGEGTDERLEAARLAPSGMNAQNWYFIADNGHIHCYRGKPKSPLGLMSVKLNSIDMGIALCHIMKESEFFRYVKVPEAPIREGWIYMGTVE